MVKIAVVFYSTYGHQQKLAEAITEGKYQTKQKYMYIYTYARDDRSEEGGGSDCGHLPSG